MPPKHGTNVLAFHGPWKWAVTHRTTPSFLFLGPQGDYAVNINTLKRLFTIALDSNDSVGWFDSLPFLDRAVYKSLPRFDRALTETL